MPWPAAMAERHQSLMVSIVPASPPTSLFSSLQYPPVSLLLLRISIFFLLFFLLFPFSVDSSSTTTTTTSINSTSTTSSASISTMTNINKTTHPATVNHNDDANAQLSTSSFDDNMYNTKTNNGNRDDTDFLKKECLTAPTSVFLSSVKSTIDEVRKATFLVSKFANTFHHDFRFTNAINDCLELLDLSAEELNWTLSSATHLQISTSITTASYYKNVTRNRPSRPADLRSWLSAALANQDTCIDGFESTHSGGFIKDLVAGGLEKVTSLVSNVLSMVRHPPPVVAQSISSSSIGSSGDRIGKHSEKAAGHDQMRRGRRRNLPSWMTPRDRRLLMLQIPIDPKSGVVSSAVDAVVAADGSGNFTRIMDAVLAAPDYSMDRYVIYIKKGKYMENVEIKKKKWNLMMIGDGIDSTIISSNRSFIDGWTTFRSATFAVTGKGFIARDLTFENTAGPEKHQAVALRSDSDLSAYYRCGIKGYQDTLYVHSLRQFYRECQISGTVDFIFGNGAVVFQNCQILVRKPLPGQKNSITAQGRKDPNQNTGFSIQFSNISADSDLAAASNTSLSSTNITTQTYLGRPWKQYSRTVFMQCYMDSVISPEGWLEWQGDFALDTLYYGEYMNYGPGAGLGSRVKWSGFHPINESTHAVNFTVARFIDGNSWLPSTGVKFIPGLVI